jgi:hypothetical protein
LVGTVVFPGVSVSADSAGFYFGADGNGPGPSGTDMPSPCSGSYGFYAGRVDSPAPTDGYMKVSYANQAQTNANAGRGNGLFAYGDLEGPKAYSGFDGTDAKATYWGEIQANAFANNYDTDLDNYGLDFPSYPQVFADMEGKNPGWLTGSSGYSNWQTLNRDVFNGFYSQIETWTFPNTSETMIPAMYTGLSFFDTYMPNQTITGTSLWEASWYYSSGTLPGSCSLSNFSINGFSPQSIFGQSTSSACFEFWQWASTNSSTWDWDQSDHAKLITTNCPA